MESRVDLGFAEECPSYLLTNRYFPSKIGGKPAWLDLRNLPRPEDLECPKCKNPMNFLCQVYAPIETDPAAFHRTIFLFICKSASCSNSADNIIALRSQLARENEFYSPIAPEEDEELPAIEPPHKLCHVCGCLGPLKCSQCKSAFYCSKSHQRIDWKSHKQVCQGSTQVPQKSVSSFLFPEFDIEMDPEQESVVAKGDDSEEADERRKQEFENLLKEGKTGNLSDVPEEELARYTATNDGDKTFIKFKKRIADYPDQVLRYQRDGEPLLIAKPFSDDMFTIPDCTMCGGKRTFEFQVMPQLLNYLKDETLDWGTILVYTCSKSCDTKSNYLREHVLKQDVTVQEVVE